MVKSHLIPQSLGFTSSPSVYLCASSHFILEARMLLKLHLSCTVAVSLLPKFPAMTSDFLFPFLKTSWFSINSVVEPRYPTVWPVSWCLKDLKREDLQAVADGMTIALTASAAKTSKWLWISSWTNTVCNLVYVLNSIPGKLCALGGKLVNQVVSDEPPRCPSCRDSSTWEEKGGVGSWVWRATSALGV